jgi:serine phosphatase RsbU (regulator of sigma subunit)
MIVPQVDEQIRCLEVWGGTEAVDRTLAVPGIDAWVFCEPYHDHVSGGDIHYVSSCFTGRVARFALADVSGHGEHASDLADKLRRMMRKHINFLDQTGLAQLLNREFAAMSEEGRFATALLLSYFAPTDHLVICNAGHPRPLWHHAAENTWEWLDSESSATTPAPNNLPLGIIDPTNYIQFSVQLAPGDLILLYTDWLPEAQSPAGELLGDAGLYELVNSITSPSANNPRQNGHEENTASTAFDVKALGRKIISATARHRGGNAFDDDRTLMLLHHNASPVPRSPVRGAIRAVAEMLGLAGD